jgi:hypothetical protein
MTQDDIIRMAREAGLAPIYSACDVPNVSCAYEDWDEEIERFAALVAAAEREKLAHWMRSMGYATGHGDTIEDLLDHLGTQIAEGLEVEALTEREACAQYVEQCGLPDSYSEACLLDIANELRARSKT